MLVSVEQQCAGMLSQRCRTAVAATEYLVFGHQAVKQLFAGEGDMRGECFEHVHLEIKALVKVVDDALLQFHKALRVS